MENKDEYLNKAIELICSNFEDFKKDLIYNKDYNSLHKSLTEVIRKLMYHDYQKLINILYRIDVNETKYLKLFKDLPSDKIAEGLAELIIERAKQKAETRRKYKND